MEVFIIIGFFLWIFFCSLVGVYGRNKGIGFGGPFIVSLVFSPLIGFIFALILGPGANGQKKCSYCAEIIKKEAKICHFCGKEQPLKSLENKSQEKVSKKNYSIPPSSYRRKTIIGLIISITIFIILVFISIFRQ